MNSFKSLSEFIPDPLQWAILVTISCTLYITIYSFLRSRGNGDVKHLPTPDSPHWLYGHELQAFEGEVQVVHGKWLQKYGPVIKLKAAFFHPDLLIIIDNAAVNHIFQNCYRYVKSPAFRPPIKDLLGEGVVWAEDDMHRHQRRILAPAFTSEAVKEVSPMVLEEARKLCKRLTHHVESSPAPCVIDVSAWFAATTLNVIGRVGFNHDFEAGQSVEAKRIMASWKKHVTEGVTRIGFFGPLILRTAPWITRLPIKALKAPGEIKMIITELARSLIDREKAGGIANQKGKDMLSRLIRMNQLEPEKLSDQHLIDNIVTLVMVGHDTVTILLSFALLELAISPGVQERLRAELKTASSNPNFLDYNFVSKLLYLDAVTKESFRLHPSSPRTERVLRADDILPLRQPVKTASGKLLNSLELKAGQVIHIPFIPAHTLPSIWGSDSYEFKPERWLEGKLPLPEDRLHGWNNLITFLDGPRVCLGYRFAVYEFKVILATIILNFAFEPTGAHIEAKLPQTLQPVADGEAGCLPLKISLVS